MYTEKDRISIKNSLERIEDNYSSMYMLLCDVDVNNKGLLDKVKDEFANHNKICEKLWNQRYTDQKYEDRWHDDLFKEYQESKSRIGVLMEIIQAIQD